MNTRIEKRYVLKKSVKRAIQKGLMVIVFLLIGLISIKNNSTMKEKWKEILYEQTLPFISTRKIYEQYIAMLTPKEKHQSVWKEENFRNIKEKTESGVILRVKEGEEIKSVESGIIVYIDSNKIILEQIDGVTVRYENVQNSQYKLYDYIEKNDILGSAMQEEIKIEFQKEGVPYDYKKYL